DAYHARFRKVKRGGSMLCVARAVGGSNERRRVEVGSRVLIFDGYGEVELLIVDDDDSGTATAHQISALSPLARALLGRTVGEQVMVRTQTGIHFVRIRGVSG